MSLNRIAHADAVEKGGIGENDVVVLPTAFEESFQYVKDTPMPLETFARAHERIKKYHSIFWGSRLILVPLQRGGHWFLAVITNAQLAQARNAVQVPPQEPNEGDSQPDQHPFGILILNSWVRNADVEFMAECLKGYLAHSWNAIQGGKLQYVYTYYPKVSVSMISLQVLTECKNLEISVRGKWTESAVGSTSFATLKL